MIDAIAAEWVKLRSLRSTYAILAVSLSCVVISAYVAQAISGSWDQGSNFETVGTGLTYAAPVGYGLLGLLGLLSVTAEYNTGMIRLSLTTVRRRATLLLAKAVVVGAVTVVAGQTLTVAMYATAQLIVGDRTIGAPLAEPTTLPELLVTGVGMAVAALTGLGLGTVLRSTAGAIVGLFTILFGLPQISQFAPSPWYGWLESLTLPALVRQLASVPDAGEFGPLGALVGLVCYAIVPLGLGVVAIIRRDA
ncbi:ABC transporter permease [Nonomuraea sp. B10E15]|uniref:ABC transporter permease n=1 Tax=Nonomuraea sp. B10E15 TaxID=3153560 RepID=UPI00325EC0DC